MSQFDPENIENNNANEFIAVLHQHNQQNVLQVMLENESFPTSLQVQPEHQHSAVSNQLVISPSLPQPKDNVLVHKTTTTSIDENTRSSISILMPIHHSIDVFGDVDFNNSNIANTSLVTSQINYDANIIISADLQVVCEKNSFIKVNLSSISYDDNASISSKSSRESCELNSVEEALRALDFALEGEDISPEEATASLECPNLLDIIVEKAKQACSDITTSHDKSHLETVIVEAKLLVDEILRSAQQVIQNMKISKCALDEPEECFDSLEMINNRISAAEILIDQVLKDASDSFEFAKPLLITKSNTVETVDDFNFNTFSHSLIDNTSTPAIDRQLIIERDTRAVAGNKLNFEDESSPVIAKANDTFELLHFPDEVNVGTIPENHMMMPKIIVPAVSDNNDSNNKQENNFEDLTTTFTPVNTPNELIFQGTWNKIVAGNLMKNQAATDPNEDENLIKNDATYELVENQTFANKTFDKVFDKTYDKGEEEEKADIGWFLHPRSRPEIDDVTLKKNDTFDIVDDPDDDRDKNIAQLRLLLGATLECANPSQTISGTGRTDDESNNERYFIFVTT